LFPRHREFSHGQRHFRGHPLTGQAANTPISTLSTQPGHCSRLHGRIPAEAAVSLVGLSNIRAAFRCSNCV
jgi:hypothetical protein